jgi:hypothetical protein
MLMDLYTSIDNFQLFQNQIVPLIARTIVLNMGLLYARRIYSDYALIGQIANAFVRVV